MGRRKKTTIIAIVLFLAAGVILWQALSVLHRATMHVLAEARPLAAQQIILDPGHGGVDGGATANGYIEKDINLSISLKLKEMLTALGYEVIMTRDIDTDLSDSSAKTIRSKKVDDIHKRLAIIEAHPDAWFISIHQNKFSDTSCKGAQMFFGPNHPNSESLALFLQEAIVSNLQSDNQRVIKKAEKNLYLLYHASVPSVLIECGFLSNPTEAQALNNEEYQCKLAYSILQGIIKYQEWLQSEGESNASQTENGLHLQ